MTIVARYWSDANGAASLFGRGNEAALDGDDLLIAERRAITRIPLLLVESVARTAPATLSVRTQDGTTIEVEAGSPDLVDFFVTECRNRIEAQRRLPPGRPPRITIIRDPPVRGGASRNVRDWNWPLLAPIAGYVVALVVVAVWLGPVVLPMLVFTPLLLAATVSIAPVIRVIRVSYTLNRHGTTVHASLQRLERPHPWTIAWLWGQKLPVYSFPLPDGRQHFARSIRPHLASTVTYDTRDPDLVLDHPLRPWSAKNIAVLVLGVVFIAVLVGIWTSIINGLG